MQSPFSPLGGVFSKTEMSEVLTEITKMDPNFDKEQFILDCKNDVIPNVLEVSQQQGVSEHSNTGSEFNF